MTSLSVDSLLVLGFVLGLRHALEADHVAAISTIVTERRSLLSSLVVGASWGFGHTLALLIAAVGVVLLRYRMSDQMSHFFELCVGIMLVVLGGNVLRTLLRPGTRLPHDHPVVAHSHSDVWLAARPLVVGMVHGLAGSAPLLLLMLTAISSPLPAFAYIAVFGVGSIIGMAMMSLLVGVPARLTHFGPAHLALRGLSGSFSVGLGLVIVYEQGLLNRLFV